MKFSEMSFGRRIMAILLVAAVFAVFAAFVLLVLLLLACVPGVVLAASWWSANLVFRLFGIEAPAWFALG